MSTIITRVQESVSRVDRTRALVMGILTGIAAFFALWKIFWLIFAAATFSSLGYWSPWLVLSLLWWGAIAALGVFWSIVFLLRYSKQP
ncbi:hypothetical protein [Mycolicibacterium stellerae]|uniref:hypothetical protein n=1 Tax=Mycolicibacterium stellerae TaxID=2358193 RepID=UPI000F0BA861|nr:hypothetical protein [Mycolicibacterium stellerae]